MSANIKVYDDIISIVNMLNGGKTIDEKINVSIAIGLFVGKTVTLARAAELSKLSLGEFIDVLKSRGEYTEEQEKMDDVAIKNLLDRMENINDLASGLQASHYGNCYLGKIVNVNELM